MEKKEMGISNYLNGSVGRLKNRRISVLANKGKFLIEFDRLLEKGEDAKGAACSSEIIKGKLLNTVICIDAVSLEALYVLIGQIIEHGIEKTLKTKDNT